VSREPLASSSSLSTLRFDLRRVRRAPTRRSSELAESCSSSPNGSDAWLPSLLLSSESARPPLPGSFPPRAFERAAAAAVAAVERDALRDATLRAGGMSEHTQNSMGHARASGLAPHLRAPRASGALCNRLCVKSRDLSDERCERSHALPSASICQRGVLPAPASMMFRTRLE
jgi:hypothetical protein